MKYSTVLWLLELQIRLRHRYVLSKVTAELQTASLTYFKKIQFSGFSPNPDG
jgi:hypothetical protein